MVLTRQGAGLSKLKDFYRTTLSGTPSESSMSPILRRIDEIEATHINEEEFRNLTSEYAVLDILKNRSGAREKVVYSYHKAISTFEPINYMPGNILY